MVRRIGEEMKSRIVKALKASGIDVKELKEIDVDKGNGEIHHGVSVIRNGTNMHPTIYIDGVPEEKLVEYIVETAKLPAPAFDESFFTNKENVLDSVFPCLINREKNADILNKAVNKDFLDLSIIYRIDVGYGYITVIRELAEKLEITDEELYNAALTNLKGKALVGNLAEVYSNRVDAEEEVSDNNPFTILTNKDMQYGAGVILDTEILKENLKGDFYIVPSSIHEMLAIPMVLSNGEVVEPIMLKGMIQTTNDDNLPERDKLSYNLYQWKNGELSIAE